MITIHRDSPEYPFPYHGTSQERLRYLIRFAILAPSFRNAQPWRFEVGDRWIDISVDEEQVAPVADADGRERTIDIGTAIDHLTLAMRWHRMEPRVEYFPHAGCPSVLARVSHQGEADPSTEDLLLFTQIERRHTVTEFINAAPLSPERLEEIADVAMQRGVGIAWVGHGTMRLEIAELVRHADELLFNNPQFRKELSDWTRDDWQKYGDGVPAEALGVSEIVQRIFPWLVGHVNLGKSVGKEEMARVVSAPALGVLCTAGDEPVDWLDAGQALSRIFLRASISGIRGSFITAPLEVPGMRMRLRKDMRLLGYPQLILRLGYGPEGRPTPRRPLDSFIRTA